MKDKTLEKTIKNLQAIIEKRKNSDQLAEALKTLEELKQRVDKYEEEELEVPLPILFSIYCGICSGPVGILGGLAVGKLIEGAINKSPIANKIATGIFKFIYDVNTDAKKEKA